MKSLSSSLAPHHQFTMEELIDDALKSVASNTPDGWKIAVALIVKQICRDKQEFTTDDVWELVDTTDLQVHDNRAMGVIIRYGMEQGWLVDTDKVKPSTRRVCHGRKIAIHRSLLC